MDFSLSESQEMLRKTARDFLSRECPGQLVRETETAGNGLSPQLWRKMAGLGWMGLIFPQEYGGLDLGFLDLAVLLEEMGRVLVPGPFLSTVLLGGYAVLSGGSDEQKREFLPGIAAGATTMTMALAEEGFANRPEDVCARALRVADGFELTGTKVAVPFADVADWLVCVARLDRDAGLFLVSGKSPGLRVTALPNIARERFFALDLDGVRARARHHLGKMGRGWETALGACERATVGECAYLLGGMEWVLEMCISYARERFQFGRPIGSFQAVQHRCADMVTLLDLSRFLTYQAAWNIDVGVPHSEEVARARVWLADATDRFYTNAHQVHGAIGFTWDHDLGLYSRRAKVAEAFLGNTEDYRELVARRLDI